MIQTEQPDFSFAKNDRHSHPALKQLRCDPRILLVHAGKNARSVPRGSTSHPNRYANRHAFADRWTAYISLPLVWSGRACQGWPPCGRQEPEGAGGERCRRRVARTADSPKRDPHRHFVTSCGPSDRHQSLLRSTPPFAPQAGAQFPASAGSGRPAPRQQWLLHSTRVAALRRVDGGQVQHCSIRID